VLSRGADAIAVIRDIWTPAGQTAIQLDHLLHSL
jgi:thiamine monophosphate synthase